jgi:hypothetical protein
VKAKIPYTRLIDNQRFGVPRYHCRKVETVTLNRSGSTDFALALGCFGWRSMP